MNHKKLAYWSIGFVILIFLSQAYLIVRLFQVNYTYLGKAISTITQDVYTKNLNTRLDEDSDMPEPVIDIPAHGEKVDTTGAYEGGYNIDNMTGVDKSSRVSIINICMEVALTKTNPIKLHVIDSLATILLEKEKIHADFYTRIVNLKTDSVLDCSRPDLASKPKTWVTLQSKNIPMNFQQDKVLQLVMLNPLKTVFVQMSGMMVLSLLLCLFCIYCLYILQTTLARQKKLAQSKNDFYNQVSHELKRPVSVVFQAIDSLLHTKAIENVERRTKYMNVSLAELHRMNSKIDMILTLSMVEEGMFELNRIRFDVLELVDEVKERYSIATTKPVELLIENELTDSFIYADRDHLFQCLSNLIDNSIKYSGEQVCIIMKLFRKNDSICLAVRDDGQGIREDDLERIFEKFERANADRKAHGYGIGLSYVRQIIEAHGGTVNVQSEWKKGTEFTLCIPQIN